MAGTIDIQVDRHEGEVSWIAYKLNGEDVRSLPYSALVEVLRLVREACAKGAQDALPILARVSANPLAISDDGWAILWD